MTARDVPVVRAIVVMGVAGSGKTTVGKMLAARVGGAFLDADDLHPESNRLKMASGVPLTDDDRQPWLEGVGRHLSAPPDAERIMVIACSALRRRYRDTLRASAAGPVHFVYLAGSRQVLAERLIGRANHFMPPALLDSQLQTLEPLETDELGLRLDIALTPESLADLAAAWIGDNGREGPSAWTVEKQGGDTPAPRSATARLSRRTFARPAAPERIVHLGLGAFHRAHQAWYTEQAADSSEWGIVAFSGHSSDLAERLSRQDGLYTLVQRGADADGFQIVGSISRAAAGDDVAGFVDAAASAATAILTLTITEAGYRLDADGRVDLSDPLIAADIELIRTRSYGDGMGWPSTPLCRVLLALDVRRSTGAPPLAVVPCDNLPDNGGVVRRALETLAAEVSTDLRNWMDRGTAFVSTSVDRITPSATAGLSAEVLDATGWLDEAPVVAEPFTDWVLSGRFPSGRPAWESAGARFVDDIEPWELRKLWMLNGAHSLLAAHGALLGHSTVAGAISDPRCVRSVRELWAEAGRHLGTVEVGDYCEALLERFSNPRIEHRLGQIALGGLVKVRLRILPVARRERNAGRDAIGCAFVLGVWIASIIGGLAPVEPSWSALLAGKRPEEELLKLVDPILAADTAFASAVLNAVEDALGQARGA
jgi:fructuronate reductase